MRRAARRFALLVVLGLAACRGDRATERHDAEGAAQVDVPLLAFLSAARALHHEANVKEESGDTAGAIAAMERLVAMARPHEGERPAPPEIDEVLADAYARLAELRVREGALDAAARAVDEGLTHAAGTTYFRGHLLEVRGLVDEARAGALADAGQGEAAAAARARAVGAFDEAIRLQEEVIKRALLPTEGGTAAGSDAGERRR